MLLTSGQISMTISSCVVFIFTSLLFLSGYILQQQTVRSLQAALHPPLPPNSTVPKPPIVKPFGHPPGSKGHASYQAYVEGNTKSTNWKKSAYVQIVREHVKVCDAIMQFAELAKQKSRTQRVLLYPRRWDTQTQKGRVDKELETSMRLLWQAAERYGVIVSAIDPLLDTTDFETAFPISGLLSLTSLEQILYLQPSGLVIDAFALDAVFGIRTDETLTAFSDPTDIESPVLLIRPSTSSFETALKTLIISPESEQSYLRTLTRFFPSPPSLPPLSSSTYFLQSAATNPNFTSSSFLEDTGYIRLSDPSILGPEYDIPRKIFLAARPDGEEVRRAWEEAYDMYRERRMGVCGLDLEPLPVLYGPEEPPSGVDQVVMGEAEENVGSGVQHVDAQEDNMERIAPGTPREDDVGQVESEVAMGI